MSSSAYKDVARKVALYPETITVEDSGHFNKHL